MQKLQAIKRKLLGKNKPTQVPLQKKETTSTSLTPQQKKNVDASFEKTVKEYGEVIRKLGNT